MRREQFSSSFHIHTNYSNPSWNAKTSQLPLVSQLTVRKYSERNGFWAVIGIWSEMGVGRGEIHQDQYVMLEPGDETSLRSIGYFGE